MEFLLLGPLEVRSARERLPLGGPRQRALLADLALHAGRGRLDGHAARRPLERRASPDGRGRRPERRSPVCAGCSAARRSRPARRATCCSVDPGAIDAHRFERLVRDARPLPPSERSAALRDALGALARAAIRRSRVRVVPAGRDRSARRAPSDRARGSARGRDRARPPRRRRRRAPRRSPRSIRRASGFAGCSCWRSTVRDGSRRRSTRTRRCAARSTSSAVSSRRAETRALQVMILTQDPGDRCDADTPQAERARPPTGGVARSSSCCSTTTSSSRRREQRSRRPARRWSDVVARHGGTRRARVRASSCSPASASRARTRTTCSARRGPQSSCARSSAEPTSKPASPSARAGCSSRTAARCSSAPSSVRRAVRSMTRTPDEILVTPAAARLGGDALELDADGRLLGVRPGRPRATLSRRRSSAGQPSSRASALRVRPRRRDAPAAARGRRRRGRDRQDAVSSPRSRTSGALVLEAACVPYGEGISFLPLQELAARATARRPRRARARRAAERRCRAGGGARSAASTSQDPAPLSSSSTTCTGRCRRSSTSLNISCARSTARCSSCRRRGPSSSSTGPRGANGAATLGQLAGDDARSPASTRFRSATQLDESRDAIFARSRRVSRSSSSSLHAHAAESDLPMTRFRRRSTRCSRVASTRSSRASATSFRGPRWSGGHSHARHSARLTSDPRDRELDGRLALPRTASARAAAHDRARVRARARPWRGLRSDRPDDRAGLHLRLARWLDHHDDGTSWSGLISNGLRSTRSRPQRNGARGEASILARRAGQGVVLGVRRCRGAEPSQTCFRRCWTTDDPRLELECRLGLA